MLNPPEPTSKQDNLTPWRMGLFRALLSVAASAQLLTAQTPSNPEKEYIYLNGRIIAIENGTGNTNVTVTIASNPNSLQVSIDGMSMITPQVLTWTPNSGHTVATTSPQSGTNGTQYVWSNWSDSGGVSHSITAPATGPLTLTANFTTQYQLAMTVGSGGTVSPATAWYNAGQIVSISATPLSGCSFAGWLGGGNGSYTGPNDPANVTLNAPITETAAFTCGSPPADTITSPPPGAKLPDNPPATFCWTNNGNYSHWLDVGTVQGYGDLYGGPQPPGTTCKDISNIPVNGGPVYVQLFSYIKGDYARPPATAVYTAPTAIFSPPDGNVFTQTTINFSWKPITGAAYYWLDVGPYQGNGGIFGGVVNGTTKNVLNILPNGGPVWARLWAFVSNSWVMQGDHQYTGCNGCVSQLTTPIQGSGLTSSTVQFCWTPIANADAYWLDVGTQPGAGDISNGSQTPAGCRTVSGVPTTGLVYAQLFTHIAPDWKPAIQYRFLGVNSLARIISPTPETQLPSSSVTFTWSAPPGATGYWLDVGTVQGSGNIYGAQQGTATSHTVNGVPSGTIWVRLWTYFGGLVVPLDFQYTR